MTNNAVIRLECDWSSQAAQHPDLFCHLCLKLSPVDFNNSLDNWPEQSPAGGGVYPHNVKLSTALINLLSYECSSTALYLLIGPSHKNFFQSSFLQSHHLSDLQEATQESFSFGED